MPLFQLLRKGSKFQWTPDCDLALQQLKCYLSSPLLLSTPTHGKALYLYLAVSDQAVSSVLIKEDNGQRRRIYYTSKILLDAETRAHCRAEQCQNLRSSALVVFSDSQLVTSQLSGDYQAQDDRMAAYLAYAKGLLSEFERAEVQQISKESNSHADALASLASAVEAGNKRTVEVETLQEPSIELQRPRQLMYVDLGPSWMDPVIAYLKNNQLSEDKTEAHKIRLKATWFWLSPDGRLYRKSFIGPYLQCVHPSKVEDFLYEIHEGTCGSHIGGRSLAY
ncbi:hypothetical protein AAC387_Pa10g0189 [Persea americana]